MIKHNAILEINLKNLAYNYKALSNLANKSICAATIKANAYGIGVIKTFETLYKNNCRHFFVATTEEALEIRVRKSLANVYVLNGLENNKLSIFNNNNIIPIINESSITPHTEAFQAVIWHLIVSHPKLKLNETKWESVSKK